MAEESGSGLDKWRLALGFTVVFGVLILGGAVALGKVEENTSHGLTGILTIIGTVVLRFSEWAFRASPERKKSAADPVGEADQRRADEPE